jgi:hypothetical protein
MASATVVFKIVALGRKLIQPLIDIEKASLSPQQPPHRKSPQLNHDGMTTARILEALS